MEIQNLPLFLKPRLRVMFSADIVGSTALKHSPPGTDQFAKRTAWSDLIQGFYFECERSFRDYFAEMARRSKSPQFAGPDPQVWKTVGDEILFHKELTNSNQLYRIISAWIETIRSVRTWLVSKDPRLDIKSTCWLAGFPCKNADVVVDVGEHTIERQSDDYFREAGQVLNRIYADEEVSNVGMDFIGPSIDVGFRLAKFATQRKMIICVDTAFMLLPTRGNKLNLANEIWFDGIEPLKGVNGGAHYPIFWIDVGTDTTLEKAADALSNSTATEPEKLKQFCDAFYCKHAQFTHPPFIVEEAEDEFTDVPEWYENLLQNMHKAFEGDGPEVDPNLGQQVLKPKIDLPKNKPKEP